MYISLVDITTVIVAILTIFLSIHWSSLLIDRILCLIDAIDQRNEPLQLINGYRRLMLIRIQNLFEKNSTKIALKRNLNSLKHHRCPICWNDGATQWIALGCGHVLCFHCTQHVYFSKIPFCPSCRTPIILSDLTLLYI